MDICPEMRELRSYLDRNGVGYDSCDDEYGIMYDGDSASTVSVDSTVDGRLLDGFTHVERTRFMSPDGREFDVTYMWTRDDDDRKVFCSTHGDLGYLEVRVGDAVPHSAYAEDIIEYAFGHESSASQGLS